MKDIVIKLFPSAKVITQDNKFRIEIKELNTTKMYLTEEKAWIAIYQKLGHTQNNKDHW